MIRVLRGVEGIGRWLRRMWIMMKLICLMG